MARTPSPAHDEKRLKRSAARLAAVQALFQMESSGEDYRTVQEEFETHRLGHTVDEATYREPDLDLFRALLSNVVSRQAEVDQLTDRALVAKWPIHRIDPTLRAVFRAAGAELIAMTATPPKVIIKEFVDVAAAFYPEGKEPSFVNAVLDHMAREIRPDAFA
ncbi:MAG: N utilization substance protein B [Paracoccaceae bacterium]|jgi:N utilization substance protein B